MSYKDLEAEIKAWANLEQHAKDQKEALQERKRQEKRDKRAAKLNAPLVPKVTKEVQKPVKIDFRVWLLLRTKSERVWGEPVTKLYKVSDDFETNAELEAIKQASKDGYHWVATVEVKRA